MEIGGKKHLVLYLEDWQTRMIKDVLGEDCITWTVPLGDGGVVRYGVGPPENPTVKRMYLTEWQMREIKDEAGEACEYVELSRSPLVKYGMPPEGIRK